MSNYVFWSFFSKKDCFLSYNLTDYAASTTTFLSGGLGDTFTGQASDIVALGAGSGLTVNSSGGTFDINAGGSALSDTSSGGSIYVYGANDYVGASNQAIFLSSTGTENVVGGYLNLTDYTASTTTFLSGGLGNTFTGQSSDIVARGAGSGLTVNSSGGTFDVNGAAAALTDNSSGGLIGVYNTNDSVHASSDTVTLGSTYATLSLFGGGNSFGLSANDVLIDQGTTQQLDSTTGYGYSTDKAVFDDTSNGFSAVQIVNFAPTVTLDTTVYTNFNDTGTPIFLSNNYTNGESVSAWNNPAGQPGVLKAIEGFTGPNDTGALAYQSLTLQGGGSS